MNKRNLAIGDHIWFNQPWAGPSAGTITAFRRSGYTKEMDYAEIQLNEGGMTGALLTDIYTSRKELLEANKKASAAQIAEYKNQMQDIEGLVRFMFDNAVSPDAGEYTDWDARQAVKERAKELLGIDLDY
jgi:hypothetical protein